MYGLDSFQASADRIVQEALKVPSHHSLLLIAHNGPHGLGDRRHDICGVDFARGAGDHGDTDLAEALARLQGEHGRHVALVAFGHMHAYLKGRPCAGDLPGCCALLLLLTYALLCVAA